MPAACCRQPFPDFACIPALSPYNAQPCCNISAALSSSFSDPPRFPEHPGTHFALPVSDDVFAPVELIPLLNLPTVRQCRACAFIDL
jgi:hypothetical protein